MPDGPCDEDVLAVHMTPDNNPVLMNQLLTPHWVQNPSPDSSSVSLNISHGGLRMEKRGLCQHEQELEEFKAANPDAAAMFDVKKGWNKREDLVGDQQASVRKGNPPECSENSKRPRTGE